MGFCIGSPGNQFAKHATEHPTNYDDPYLEEGNIPVNTVNNYPDILQRQETLGDAQTELKEEQNNNVNKPTSKPTGRQYLVLITICLSSMCGATFYSLLAPFFPTEVRSLFCICNFKLLFALNLLLFEVF